MPEIYLCSKQEYHDLHIWQPAWIGDPVQCPGLRWQTLTQSVEDAESMVSKVDILTNHSLTGMSEEQTDWDADEDDRCQPIGCDNGHHVQGCLYLYNDKPDVFVTGGDY